MTEVAIPPYPVLAVHAQPPSAMDSRVRRILEKEFRAAGWNAERLQWISPPTIASARGAVLYVSCEGSTTAAEMVLAVRIGLAHFIAGTRAALPNWKIDFDAQGVDGTLCLTWDLEAAPPDVVESLIGLVPGRQTHASKGRRFWDERDGGISALTNGTWTWDVRLRTWRARDA